jgi:hypothetical protein
LDGSGDGAVVVVVVVVVVAVVVVVVRAEARGMGGAGGVCPRHNGKKEVDNRTKSRRGINGGKRLAAGGVRRSRPTQRSPVRVAQRADGVADRSGVKAHAAHTQGSQCSRQRLATSDCNVTVAGNGESQQ